MTRNRALTKLAAVLLLAALATPGQAVFTKIGMAGLTFLKIAPGRGAAMGDAFVAIADDATAAYWNPAGLALLTDRQAVVNHIDWIADINHEFVAVAIPTRAGNIAVSVTALTMGKFEETTIEQYQGTGLMFTGSDLAVGVSYARLITEKLGFGLTAKVLNEQIWDMGATGAAFDFGVHYNTGWRNLRLAMAITNFGPDVKYSGSQLNFTFDPDWEWPWSREPIPGSYLTENFALPVTFRFGLAYDFWSNEASYLTLAADLNHANDVNEKVNVGFEYNYRPLYLRAGYVVNTDVNYASDLGWKTGLSFGIGLRVRPAGVFGLKLDYAYRDLDRLGSSHRVGLAAGF